MNSALVKVIAIALLPPIGLAARAVQGTARGEEGSAARPAPTPEQKEAIDRFAKLIQGDATPAVDVDSALRVIGVDPATRASMDLVPMAPGELGGPIAPAGEMIDLEPVGPTSIGGVPRGPGADGSPAPGAAPVAVAAPVARNLTLRDDPKWFRNFQKFYFGEASDDELRGFGWQLDVENRFPSCARVAGFGSGSGVLIGPNVVLTAAHVVGPNFMTLGIKQMTIFGLDCRAGADFEKSQRSARLIRHSGYDPATNLHDIGLVILEDDIQGIAPVKLVANNAISATTHVFGVGYGLNETGVLGLRQWGPLILGGDPGPFGAHPNEVLSMAPGVDACKGDSGGPCFVEVKEGERTSYRVAAIISRGITGRSTCGEGGIQVRVDPYLDWIKATCLANGGRLATADARGPAASDRRLAAGLVDIVRTAAVALPAPSSAGQEAAQRAIPAPEAGKVDPPVARNLRRDLDAAKIWAESVSKNDPVRYRRELQNSVQMVAARGVPSVGQFSPRLRGYFEMTQVGQAVGARLMQPPLPDSPLLQPQISLEAGDIITHLDGVPVRSLAELENHLAQTTVGIINVRNARPQINTVILPGRLGVLVAQATIAHQPIPGRQPDATSSHGLRVTYIEPDSPAHRAGIRQGDVILAAGPRDTPTVEDLNTCLGGQVGPLRMLVADPDGRPRWAEVPPPAAAASPPPAAQGSPPPPG